MICNSIESASAISQYSDRILMCLVSASHPEQAIFRLYDQAEDKDVFIAGLVGTLLLRHRQWQAACGSSAGAERQA
jgi:hypothetical protein